MDGDDDGVVPDQGKHTICVSPPRRSSGDVDDGFALGFLLLCSVVSRIMHHRYTVYIGRRKMQYHDKRTPRTMTGVMHGVGNLRTWIRRSSNNNTRSCGLYLVVI